MGLGLWLWLGLGLYIGLGLGLGLGTGSVLGLAFASALGLGSPESCLVVGEKEDLLVTDILPHVKHSPHVDLIIAPFQVESCAS